MQGKVIKILSNKCHVKYNNEVIICSVRGKLRTNFPLVGDNVIFDYNKKVVEDVLIRKNSIRRPPVSNITKAIVVTSFNNPDFSTNLIDKLLIELEFNNIKPIICLTKRDLITDEEFKLHEEEINYYKKIGYKVYFNTELEELKKEFKDNVTVFIGQTGAGKSTLLNRLEPNLNLETGEVSIALGRGKHTTRFIQIIDLFGGEVLDTPGFSALEFQNMTKKEVKDSFIEFKNYPCIYKDCLHINEPECKIKEAVLNNQIAKFRYENYLNLVKTALDEKDKYKRR